MAARVAGAALGAVAAGALAGLAVFAVIVLPLSFFASVTEPSAGRQRPLFTTGVAVATWLGAAAALLAAAAVVRHCWRADRRADTASGP